MAEMIVPGTYITVLSEGLISAGRIATGIIGVVGTAASGPVEKPTTLAGFGNAREIFGLPDDFKQPKDGTHPLTLVRALEYIYNNGASTVVAVRVAGSGKSSASFAVLDNDGKTVATLAANSPGTWGSDIHIKIDKAEDDCRIEGETHDSEFKLNYHHIVPSNENRIRIFQGTQKVWKSLYLVYKELFKNEVVVPDTNNRFYLKNKPIEEIGTINFIEVLNKDGTTVRKYGTGFGKILYDKPPQLNEILITKTSGEIIFDGEQKPGTDMTVVATYATGHADPKEGEVLVTVWDGSLLFAKGEEPQQVNGDKMEASYLIERDICDQVTLTYGAIIERYTVPDGKILAQLINKYSKFVTAEANKTAADKLPKSEVVAYFGTGTNTPGSDGAEAGKDEYKTGLESLENELINIVVLAGQDATTMGSVLEGHLNATEQTDHERIGVIGANGSTIAEFLGHSLAHERMILVAPGITNNGTVLPSPYTAAAIAGLISSLPVQTSLTNKTLTIPGLAIHANRGQQEQLIKRNVLTVINKDGFRILKGITTSGEGTPFSAIPTRRIVDYAKYGVRSAANPYLGRLNNTRVRAAMKATLDAFLTRMVQDEALTKYELEVTATRAQEISGEVSVVMTLQPTFSIEYIRVTMILK